MGKHVAPNRFEVQEIERVKKYAADHALTLDQLRQAVNNDIPPVGDNLDHVCFWGNFRIVFSYEDQSIGRCAHLSVSLPEGHKKNLPTPADIQEILPLFEMGNDLYNCENVWIEDNVPAVNVLRRMNQDA